MGFDLDCSTASLIIVKFYHAHYFSMCSALIPLFLALLQLSCCICHLSRLLHAILSEEVTVLHSPGVKQPLSYRDCSLQSQLAGTKVIHISPNHQIFKLFAFSSLCEKKTLRKCHFIFTDLAQSCQYGTFNPGSFLPMGLDHWLIYKHLPAAVQGYQDWTSLTYLLCSSLIRTIRLRWPCEYCSITSRTSQGFLACWKVRDKKHAPKSQGWRNYVWQCRCF